MQVEKLSDVQLYVLLQAKKLPSSYLALLQQEFDKRNFSEDELALLAMHYATTQPLVDNSTPLPIFGKAVLILLPLSFIKVPITVNNILIYTLIILLMMLYYSYNNYKKAVKQIWQFFLLGLVLAMTAAVIHFRLLIK